jgi:hypothetical protein
MPGFARLDLPVEGSVYRVVFQEVRQARRIGDVVDRDDLAVRAGVEDAEDVAADAAEPVDRDAHGHGWVGLAGVSGRNGLAWTLGNAGHPRSRAEDRERVPDLRTRRPSAVP